MNETITPNAVSDVPWPTSSDAVRFPHASTLQATERTPSAAGATLKRVVEGVHNAVDQLSDRAAPQVEKLSDSVASAEAALRDRADQLVKARDEWADSLRNTVRANPLGAIAAALALGAVIARITR